MSSDAHPTALLGGSRGALAVHVSRLKGTCVHMCAAASIIAVVEREVCRYLCHIWYCKCASPARTTNKCLVGHGHFCLVLGQVYGGTAEQLKAYKVNVTPPMQNWVEVDKGVLFQQVEASTGVGGFHLVFSRFCLFC